MPLDGIDTDVKLDFNQVPVKNLWFGKINREINNKAVLSIEFDSLKFIMIFYLCNLSNGFSFYWGQSINIERI